MLRIIDFWAGYCMPCKMMQPILDRVKEYYPNLEIEEINIEEFPEVAKAYQVSNIPTYVFEVDGLEVNRRVGAVPLPKFAELVRQYYQKEEEE